MAIKIRVAHRAKWCNSAFKTKKVFDIKNKSGTDKCAIDFNNQSTGNVHCKSVVDSNTKSAFDCNNKIASKAKCSGKSALEKSKRKVISRETISTPLSRLRESQPVPAKIRVLAETFKSKHSTKLRTTKRLTTTISPINDRWHLYIKVFHNKKGLRSNNTGI